MNYPILIEETNLLGKKKERDKEPLYFTKEESYNYYESKNKYIPKDIELISSYSKNLFERLKQSPVEIINILVSPYTSFNQIFLEMYNKLLERIKGIETNHKKIIKYIYNNGIIQDEPALLPCDSNQIQIIDNNIKEEEQINHNFRSLNSWEISKSLKEYKWEGIIKILIIFGDNGFIKQIIKNIDCYHNNYLIINLNKITKKEKSHFNDIINNKYFFEDLINYLKQDIYEHLTGKNNIKEISDKYNEYYDLLKRYLNYDLNIISNNNIDNNYIYMNFFRKNNIIIKKEEWALFDSNSFSKSYICQCFTSKIKKNFKNGISNLLNPEYIFNQIEVELSISNNIYNIINNDEDSNINFHINNLTLGKKMIGTINNKINKNNYTHEFFINNILLNYAICDYICDLFNMRLFENNINLNTIEIHFYESSNYNAPYFIGKECPLIYKQKYNQELYEAFSHYSFCISHGKILIEDIKEYNGKIYSFNIFKDEYDLNDEENINIFRFFCYHKCNNYCKVLKLNNVDINFYDNNTGNFMNKRICDICKVIFDITHCNYDYEKDDLCLCINCYKKIYESKYERVCGKCGNKFGYYYLFYILQKIEPPSICESCKKLENNKDNKENNNIEEFILNNKNEN